MTFTPTPLAGSYLITLEPVEDHRGWFARYYDEQSFAQIGHGQHWVQMNHSFTYKKGTVRGLHFQLPPHAEVKLVRCIAGWVYDVIIDLRKESPTFLQWYGVTLSAVNRNMMYVPAGFAHGFQTLEDNCELLYHHSAAYTPEAESGIRYNDEMLKINWPLRAGEISDRDLAHPLLTESFKGIQL